jgi:hypothetical protein
MMVINGLKIIDHPPLSSLKGGRKSASLLERGSRGMTNYM